MPPISYNEPAQIGYASIDVTTSGVDILTISEPAYMRKSQLSIMVKADLTTATNVKLDFLYSPDNGTTWVATPIISSSTGIAASVQTIINNTSYLVATNFYGAIIDIPLSAATQFKIKGTATSATSAACKVWVFARDN